ncbi:MAG: DNA polymerase III subunit epsilon [Firmicutes bacterium HGW-Firmicutes-8]|nr:MAG: DNA polymerase III subunit epsilon [Firmicutes bacterium HGW-Firmicutes-8]
MDRIYAFLDIETTGLNPDTDDIIEIGAVTACKGEIIDRFHTLVKPSKKLPLKIKNLTGITDDMLEKAPSPADIREALLTFLGNFPIVGHNITFDTVFLNRKMGGRIDNRLLDTLDFVQVALPRAASYRLDSVKSILGVEKNPSHRALGDAETACALFFKCFELLYNLDHQVLMQIYQLTTDLDSTFAQTLSGHLAHYLAKFPTGKAKASISRLDSQTFDEHSLFAEPEGSDSPANIEISTLAEFLGPAGPFAEKYPQFKFRPGQVDMLETVARGFAAGKHMVIESGTGTGKSLAYLIPAIAWAVSNKTKVAVTTHTINLQEQLWENDLPNIKDMTGLDFKAALVKGRNNYLCLRRWEAKIREAGQMGHSELLYCLKILVWLTETVSGDKSEINTMPGQKQYWNDLSSDQDSCLGAACPFFNRLCFVTGAKRKAELADLLVVNHSLLLADVRLNNKLLPAYEYLIIDEAHHLEGSATEQLGWTISTNSLRFAVLSFVRGFNTGLSPGLFNLLKQVFKKNADLFGQADCDKFDRAVKDAFENVTKITESIKELDEFLKSWASTICEEHDELNYLSVRVRDSHRGDDLWEVLVSITENYSLRTYNLVQTLRRIAGLFESLNREQQKDFLPLLKDIQFQIKNFAEINTNIALFMQGLENYVYWIEIDKGPKQDVKIRCAPVSVSELLYENLFKTKKSILLTSATLSVDGSFDHFTDRVGLSFLGEESVIKRLYTSPFSYEKQSLLSVVRDLPDPTSVSDGEYVEHIAPVIGNIARIFNGRTLVLFTSHHLLRGVYDRLRQELENADIVLLGHKIDGGRTRLVNDFRKSRRAVLFGAGSFWEGIDLPGDILKCVVIVRLPFAPPNTPIIEARIEELVKAQKDAFYNYSVPEAIIKLKQGFGRLIRTEEDEGVVVILDRRIVDRKYGRKFLNSLPLKTHVKGDSLTVLQKISDWVEGERSSLSSLNILDTVGDLEKYLNHIKMKRSETKTNEQ